MNAIEIHALTKRYKKLTAVNGLELTVPEGELFALLGVNGAGKTTTIRMLCCLAKPTSGDALLLGHSVTNEEQAVKQVISVSPQETAVAPNLTVWENLVTLDRIYGAAKNEAEQKAEQFLEQFGMQSIRSQKAKTLSGGWQRRLSIAMALISSPKVLFLDEPTLGLDVLARRELWEIVRELKGKMTIVLTTHYLEEAEALADRIGIMAAGSLRALGTAEELKQQTGKENFEDAFVALCK